MLKNSPITSRIDVIPKLSMRSIREISNAQKTIHLFWKKSTLNKQKMLEKLKSEPTQFVSIIEHLIKDKAVAVAMIIYFDLVIHYHDTFPDIVKQCSILLEDLLLDGENLKLKIQSADIIWDYFQFIALHSQNTHFSLHMILTQNLLDLDLVKIASDSLTAENTNPLKMKTLFNQLINNAKAIGQHQSVCNLYGLMKRRGIEPNIITLTSCIDSCNNFNDIDKFNDFFKSLKSSFDIDKVQTPTFTALLKSLLKLNLSKKSTDEVLYYLKSARWIPNKTTAMVIFPLMRKYKAGEIHDYLTSNLLPKLNHNHPYISNVEFNHELITNPVNYPYDKEDQQKMFDHLVELDSHKAESLIMHLCHGAEVAHVYNDLFNQYRLYFSDTYVPSRKVITKLLHTSFKHGDHKQAEIYLDLLTKLGYTPTHYTNYAVLHGLDVSMGSIVSRKVYQSLVDNGYQPNTTIYAFMTGACLKAGLPTLANYFFLQFFQSGTIPTTFTYNILLKYALDKRKVDFSEVLINSMSVNNVDFNIFTYEILIKGYYNNGDYVRSSYFYGNLLHSGLPIIQRLRDFIQENYYLYKQVDVNFSNHQKSN
ncbi:hypothetical protein CONCODRAFT_77563 [Conidiobolus coronatus NRRL 28638]|uniref:Pentacotripeptide-repeat region of PRORP domain-containing protein n=1 Tax=Conidiobolus coronatus (strain ATCC 28846 / CBS 209.66 / NRRL 28638) TaxID=796925 RepID=A0A137PD68_CONC2|nr:hypothetical protein CONCODRAFT_77563 [Conidiobolus coronatus NRRL 28638]|eukprot:KXN72915.1 hypothetical protein CONCODRAFT_77563 [Conidiobolus coronatus NRRL 28638]